ncbi:hypothetical protein T492DRAFT_494240 [Pavlovales sp. CCMP2436]|nr:hypothetical protein T492DRAFT_494240 [Pavlovales sp. CCMP2436]
MSLELQNIVRKTMREDAAKAAGSSSSSSNNASSLNAADAASLKKGDGGAGGKGAKPADGTLHNVRVELSLGSRPPHVLGARLAALSTAMANEPAAFCVEFKVNWAGDGYVVVKAEVGRKLFSIDVSFALRALALRGEMRLEVAPRPNPPYIGPCRLSFLSSPEVHFELTALGSFDIMEVPWVERKISDFFKNNLFAGVTAPNAAAFEWPEVASAPLPHALTVQLRTAAPVPPPAGGTGGAEALSAVQSQEMRLVVESSEVCFKERTFVTDALCWRRGDAEVVWEEWAHFCVQEAGRAQLRLRCGSPGARHGAAAPVLSHTRITSYCCCCCCCCSSNHANKNPIPLLHNDPSVFSTLGSCGDLSGDGRLS